MSDYIYTYTKKFFNPLKPKVEDISVIDIAHALSLLTRANGHIQHFYSVAQHCLNCFYEAKERLYSKKIQLGCLLHDGSEAYLSDIIRPVKNRLYEYKYYEKKIQDVIWLSLGDSEMLSPYEMELISEIDDIMLYYEFECLHNTYGLKKPPFIKTVPNFEQIRMKDIEKLFVKEYYNLKSQK